MARYGVDKPDTRFGMLLHDVTAIMQASGVPFLDQGLLQNGGISRAFVVPQGSLMLNRTVLERLQIFAKGIGSAPFAILRVSTASPPTLSGSIKLPPTMLTALMKKLAPEPGDAILLATGPDSLLPGVMGRLRLQVLYPSHPTLFPFAYSGTLTPNPYPTLHLSSFSRSLTISSSLPNPLLLSYLTLTLFFSAA